LRLYKQVVNVACAEKDVDISVIKAMLGNLQNIGVDVDITELNVIG